MFTPHPCQCLAGRPVHRQRRGGGRLPHLSVINFICTAPALSALFPKLQVARCIVSGAARGDYHIRGPDVGLNILVASMAGFSPRVYNWCFEIVLAPLLVLLAKLAVPLADRIVRKHRAAEGGS